MVHRLGYVSEMGKNFRGHEVVITGFIGMFSGWFLILQIQWSERYAFLFVALCFQNLDHVSSEVDMNFKNLVGCFNTLFWQLQAWKSSQMVKAILLMILQKYCWRWRNGRFCSLAGSEPRSWIARKRKVVMTQDLFLGENENMETVLKLRSDGKPCDRCYQGWSLLPGLEENMNHEVKNNMNSDPPTWPLHIVPWKMPESTQIVGRTYPDKQTFERKKCRLSEIAYRLWIVYQDGWKMKRASQTQHGFRCSGSLIKPGGHFRFHPIASLLSIAIDRVYQEKMRSSVLYRNAKSKSLKAGKSWVSCLKSFESLTDPRNEKIRRLRSLVAKEKLRVRETTPAR